MTTWTEMQPIQFDASLAKDRKAREVVATAADTLFPGLLPQPKQPGSSGHREPMPGEMALFDLDEP